MAKAEHLGLLRRGPEAVARWKRAKRYQRLDLSGADLSGLNLTCADLADANMQGVKMQATCLNGANMQHARLNGAQMELCYFTNARLNWASFQAAKVEFSAFVDADLTAADFSHASLRGSILTRAKLVWTDLSNTDLTLASMVGATFYKAICDQTDFGDTDLSRAADLDTIQHYRPSIVGLGTLFRSRVKFPVSFLRRCGATRRAASLLQPEAGRRRRYWSCFISHSIRDSGFVQRLYKELRSSGVNAWCAPGDMRGGEALTSQLTGAIKDHDKVILVLTPHSIGSSWVGFEICKARAKERRTRSAVLFPVRLMPMKDLKAWSLRDPRTGEDLAHRVCELYVPDFSRWRDEAYFSQEVSKLLATLARDGRDHRRHTGAALSRRERALGQTSA